MVNKILILFLLVSPLYAIGQETVTIDIDRARLLISDAFRARYQDTLIFNLTQQGDSLRKDLDKAKQTVDQLNSNIMVTEKLNVSYRIETGQRIEGLQKDVKREEKKGKFWQTISTILAGAVVVETIIIFTKD